MVYQVTRYELTQQFSTSITMLMICLYSYVHYFEKVLKLQGLGRALDPRAQMKLEVFILGGQRIDQKRNSSEVLIQRMS